MSGRTRGRSALVVPVRLVVPEGLLLAGLLALPLLPSVAAAVQPRGTPLLVIVALIGLALGLRFARGRVVHALLVLLAAAAIPLLPEGPTATLAALLVPLNLAALALLPDRGVLTRGGILRTGAVIVQAAVVAVMVGTRPPGAADLFPVLMVPGAALELDAVLVVYAVALAATGALATATGAAPARGSFWATAGALAAHMGAPGGASYVLATSGVILVIATLEDAYALAYRDALTGLPSRRALDELLDRTSRRLTVAMVDVDHFKAFNDKHGHDVGDQVLRLVATKLKEAGGGGRAYRYGGEEFTLVFRGRTLKEAEPFLDEVREAVAAAEFIVRSPGRPKKKPRRILPRRGSVKKLNVTVSIGAAERKDRSRPATEVLRAADAALYRAKEAGRNRVVASGRRA